MRSLCALCFHCDFLFSAGILRTPTTHRTFPAEVRSSKSLQAAHSPGQNAQMVTVHLQRILRFWPASLRSVLPARGPNMD